jgi:thiamine biosynthesis lipoprotein
VARYQQTAHVLGSTAFLTIVSDTAMDEVSSLFKQLWGTIHDFETRFSRFLEGSELTQFNRQSGHEVRITAAFHDLLRATQQLADQTNGLYDPFILPELQRAGYINSWPHPERTEGAIDYRDRTLGNISSLQLGDDWAYIPKSTALDFGGIGKGYLLDQLADLLEENHITDYWLSLGGDIICKGYDNDHGEWEIAVEDARHGSEVAETIQNTNGRKMGIATSGTIKRKGSHAGHDWHHIIDPRTGGPARTDLSTATVIAQSAVLADVYAKALIILGSKEALIFMQEHQLERCILQREDGSHILWPRQKGMTR